jgi:hypothetical protein
MWQISVHCLWSSADSYVVAACLHSVHMPAEPGTDQALRSVAGDWHRAVHVWLYAMDSQRLLIQKRMELKDSWPGRWDISAAGHGATLRAAPFGSSFIICVCVGACHIRPGC